MTKAVVLLNLGTPSEPTTKGLREYYKYFFSDPYVFDMNPVARWALRNLIILPFRAPRIAKDYAAIWTDEGSPLKVYAERMQASVQAEFEKQGSSVLVRNAMGYSKPFISDTMAELEEAGVKEVTLLPMFPQYSTATTESVFAEVRKSAAKWKTAPRLNFVKDLFTEPAFVRAWSILIAEKLKDEAIDHVVFSYHGVPEKTINKADSNGVCEFGQCCESISEKNRYCYRMQCVQTTEAIVNALGWDKDKYSFAFQSRFGPLPWLQPYLDEHLTELVNKGVKRVAVVTPSFISDCLETLFEIGIEYRHSFEEAGGEKFVLIPNLNDEPAWFASVYEMANKHLAYTI